MRVAMSREFIPSATLIVLISTCWCFGAFSPSLAQETPTIDGFVWKKDKSNGNEIALSRGDDPFNFFDIGDLSYFSTALVERYLRIMATTAGLTIDRSPSRNSSIAIVHDAKVFSRLKNDRHAFSVLGFADETIEILQQKSPNDAKCVSMTVSDSKNDIINTIVLNSEKSGVSENADSCLVSSLLNSFGITGVADINIKTLVNTCVLYEGRRRGIRDRAGLTLEASRLRDLCMAKAQGGAPGAPPAD
jgi:hypothetical protein